MTESAIVADEEGLWPELPWREWEPTISTLHMWTQMVGKVRMALAPPQNHWWHTTLYGTSRGLTTSPIPYRDRMFQVDFDFIDHRLEVTDTAGRSLTIPLVAQSVARFYGELMDGLHSLDIDVRIWTKPVEVAEAIPFELDERHHTYDRGHAHLFWRGLLQAEWVMKEFQTGFVGKASPVQFFWGGFDLSASRYSGRAAPRHPGGVPNCPTWVMEEAYCREESSIGWWPLSDEPGPSFYAYTYPEPDGFRTAPAGPPAAFFDNRFREFLLPYDAVRASSDPDRTALEFFQATYELGADLGGWDRANLEPAVRPDRPPRRPWSIVPSDGDGGANRSGGDSANSPSGDPGARTPA